MKQFGIIPVALALLALVPALRVGAVTNTWIATGTNDWSNTNNWSTTNLPAAGDDVVITNANVGVLLTNSTAELSSFLMSNKCSLIFSNWDTFLKATNVTLIGPTGLITCAGPFTNTAMSNRVYIICTNITLAVGGSINVDSKGYSGGAISNDGHGSGAGKYGSTTTRGSGAGYGGIGGRTTDFGYGGLPYGIVSAPDAPGSGGGASAAYAGGAGGGAIFIQASGMVTNNGSISANGGDAVNIHAGGGSGGGIYITCAALAGSGAIRANGGVATGAGGSGAGGRIAIVYDPATQAAAGPPNMQLFASRGSANNTPDLGTLYCPDTALLSTTITNIQAQVWGVTNWGVSNLVVSNVWVRFPEDGFRLVVTGDLRVVGATGLLELGGTTFNIFNIWTPANLCGATNGPTLDVYGNLMLTNSGILKVYAAITNAVNPNYGAFINVWSNLIIASNSWVYPISHNTNGGSPFFQVRNLIVAGTNGGFNANALGFSSGARQKNGWGPGGGPQGGGSVGGGGGYGGGGGASSQSGGGATYGDSNAPLHAGSGGGGYNANYEVGGRGGGLIRVFANEAITMNGILSANGGYAANGGAAAGGGIYLRCRTFIGATNAIIRANGANGNGVFNGGGGGGRIAVWRMYDVSSGAVSNSVSGGTGYSTGGTNGTVVWGWVPVPGTIFTAR